MINGTLYGIGVGPGDPELITLKAVRILRQVDVVFAAASTGNSHSLAMKIVETYSHLNGLEFLIVHKPKLWKEITVVRLTVEQI